MDCDPVFGYGDSAATDEVPASRWSVLTICQDRTDAAGARGTPRAAAEFDAPSATEVRAAEAALGLPGKAKRIGLRLGGAACAVWHCLRETTSGRARLSVAELDVLEQVSIPLDYAAFDRLHVGIGAIGESAGSYGHPCAQEQRHHHGRSARPSRRSIRYPMRPRGMRKPFIHRDHRNQIVRRSIDREYRSSSGPAVRMAAKSRLVAVLTRPRRTRTPSIRSSSIVRVAHRPGSPAGISDSYPVQRTQGPRSHAAPMISSWLPDLGSSQGPTD